jgi:glycosyl transferase family 2
MPLVTVLMAVHNGGAFLRESIDSILSQTFADFEFLIVDDGSTDRSQEVVLSYTDPRIRLLVNDRNRGLSASLNRGLREARGTYVARQDADDISEATRLEREVAHLEKHRDVALLGTCYTKIDEAGKFLGHRRLPLDYVQIRWSLLFYCAFAHTSVMFRRRLVMERVGTYDESYAYAQDYDLWWRIAEVLPVENLLNRLVTVRISQSSMTATYGGRLMEGPRISIAHLAPLLEWNIADVDGNLKNYNRLHCLLYGSPHELPGDEITRAIEQIVNLVPAFCRQSGLGSEESRQLYQRVRSRLAWRLVQMGSVCSDEEYSSCRKLIVGRGQLHWLDLFALRAARHAFAFLGGPQMLAALEHSRPR